MNATKRLLAGVLIPGTAALALPAWAQSGGLHGMVGHSDSA